MLALKHLVFCLSVSAAYADVEFRSWKKPSDNNPDLNRKDLGAMQDAWKTIKCMANQSYYLIYSSGRGTRKHYPHVSCLQVQTSDLNNTLKSAKYTSKWCDTKCKTKESSTQYVQAVKQKDYSVENIMYLGQPQRKATSPNGTCYNLDFNFICGLITGCDIYHQECWRRPFTKYSEKYVLFSNSFCHVLRSLQNEDDYESCEFWLREDWLKNVTIPQVLTKARSEESEEKEKGFDSSSKTTYSYNSLFKELPSSCRYAFLLNCGYPTYRIYDKEDCDKVDKTDKAASGDVNAIN
uniref:Lipocalin n=1 Tax=Ixodes ricinus TaxID=34613 RepID=B7ZDH0_IXORI|nr:lipocalin [Ixodes ricinus]